MLIPTVRSERPAVHTIIKKYGQKVYRVDFRSKRFDRIRSILSAGKASREFSTLKEAEEQAAEAARLVQQHGSESLAAFEFVLNENPMLLQEMLTPYGKTIRQAVEFYAEHLRLEAERQKTETLGKLVDEWLATKKKEVDAKPPTLRPRTYQTLRSMGAKYKAKWGDRPVGTITSREIEDWVEGLKIWLTEGVYEEVSQQTKWHHWSYLSQFFRWSRKRHGVPLVNPCESVEIKKADRNPEFFPPEICQSIMDLCQTKRFIDLLPFHAICMFSGVRPTECGRLTWGAIDFEDSSIVVSKQEAKTRKNRRVEMKPNLAEWLIWYRTTYPRKPIIPKTNFIDSLKSFRKTFGGWVPNGMRHSYASYFLGQKKGGFAELEQYMGNSRTMLQNHYVTFPTKEESASFWSIRPPTDKPEP